MTDKNKYDFLIIGSGLAGLFAAYQASKYGKVLLLTKIDERKSNSWLAQGGIAVALGEEDSIESHIEDSIIAGRGICDNEAVKVLVEEGISCVRELIDIGMKFDKKNGKYLFGLEGGHSRRRILHANGTLTGEVITKFLINKVKNISNISFFTNTQVVDLIKVDDEIIGMKYLDLKSSEVSTVFANSTIIATGGYNNIYYRNTNPKAAIGEGISMALNVGVEIQDMEFTQFHPTAFYSESRPTFLISEAIRGEGAYLLNAKGERFMSSYHEKGELAPRDIVAGAIHDQISKSDNKHIYLDARHLNETLLKEHFKNIYNFTLAEGINITTDLIPIAPAAHYSIGGIKTDLFGATNIARLFAIGEAASTRVHGANRLASNSLLECLVFAKRSVLKAYENLDRKIEIQSIDNAHDFIKKSSIEHYQATLSKIQIMFTEKVGIVRDEIDLNEALKQIEKMNSDLPKTGSDIYLRKEKNLLSLSKSIVITALYRKESRGTHQRRDYQKFSSKYSGHIVINNSKIDFEKINER